MSSSISGGNYYDSKLEADYSRYLDRLIELGKVKEYKIQQMKPLIVNGKTIANYRLDFEVYYMNGKIEFVEVKGFWNEDSLFKVKLFEALNNVSVRIVKKVPSLPVF